MKRGMKRRGQEDKIEKNRGKKLGGKRLVEEV
jgi:hypothetical protein